MAEIVPLKPPAPFAVGDQVALNSGGVIMTVTATWLPVKPGEPWLVTTSWHNEAGDPVAESYPAPALYRHVEEAPETAALRSKSVSKQSRQNWKQWLKSDG